jgi:hypothetical protein
VVQFKIHWAAIGFGPWETVGMTYSPQVGDIVTAEGKTGKFKVWPMADNGWAQVQPCNGTSIEIERYATTTLRFRNRSESNADGRP